MTSSTGAWHSSPALSQPSPFSKTGNQLLPAGTKLRVTVDGLISLSATGNSQAHRPDGSSTGIGAGVLSLPGMDAVAIHSGMRPRPLVPGRPVVLSGVSFDQGVQTHFYSTQQLPNRLHTRVQLSDAPPPRHARGLGGDAHSASRSAGVSDLSLLSDGTAAGAGADASQESGGAAPGSGGRRALELQHRSHFALDEIRSRRRARGRKPALPTSPPDSAIESKSPGSDAPLRLHADETSGARGGDGGVVLARLRALPAIRAVLGSPGDESTAESVVPKTSPTTRTRGGPLRETINTPVRIDPEDRYPAFEQDEGNAQRRLYGLGVSRLAPSGWGKAGSEPRRVYRPRHTAPYEAKPVTRVLPVDIEQTTTRTGGVDDLIATASTAGAVSAVWGAIDSRALADPYSTALYAVARAQVRRRQKR